MTWICENCGKEFRNRNQWHSCRIVNLDDHIKNKPQHIIQAFEKLLDIVSGFGEIEIIPKATSIQFRAMATFLGVKLKRNEMIIEFFLSREIEHYLIIKKMRVSGKRIIYYLTINEAEQIDSELSKLLKEAFNLVYKQKS